jgi:hypothetical protein
VVIRRLTQKNRLNKYKEGKKMKKLAIALVIALIATVFVAVPTLAWGGNADANVDCTDIGVDNSEPLVGTSIQFHGTVKIVATAEDCGLGVSTYASSSAWYTITGPDGVIYDHINILPGPLTDTDTGLFYASADASYDYYWEQDVDINSVGDYVAMQGGEAYAYYGHWELQWVQTGSKWCRGHLELVYVIDGSDYDNPDPISLTATSHAGVVASTTWIRPFLVIELPDGSKHFFSNDGWGDPTTEEIVYTDGIWQVTIAAGTAIQLDGSWHQTTYLDVDNQGNVTGRYNAGGSTVAEDIGLSQPITITKVG